MNREPGEGEFEDRDLRRALLLSASDRAGEVSAEMIAELERCGYLVRTDGRASFTSSGREFLTTEPSIPPKQVRRFLIATRELLRVIPLGAEQLDDDGARVVLTSAEIWNNEVTVHWTNIGVEPGAGWRTPGAWAEPARLSDDVGTGYQTLAGGSGGDGYVTDGRARFSGVVPDDATKLYFVPRHAHRLEAFTIDLSPG